MTCDLDRLTWLELARRLLGWHEAPPSLMWSDGAAGRLLISLGAAPPSLLLYRAKLDHSGASLWPLTTDRVDAIETARQALKPAHMQSIDGPNPLEVLLASLSS
jgi:hypothetical protein